MKPTDEQIKRFWEKCGLRVVGHNNQWEIKFNGKEVAFGVEWEIQDWVKMFDITLDNLFKFAVPKFVNTRSWNWSKRAGIITGTIQGAIENNNDVSEALFWAIYKAWGLK